MSPISESDIPDFFELTKYWLEADDALHNAHGSINVVHYGDSRRAGVTPADLMVSVAVKMEYYLKQWIPLNLSDDTKIEESVFFVLLRDRLLADIEKKKKEHYWTWRMSQMITQLGVIQALLEPEVSNQKSSATTL